MSMVTLQSVGGGGRRILVVGLGLMVMSVPTGLVGLFVFLARVRLAVALLGARVMFGMAWGQADAVKVGAVGLAGLALIGLATLLFVSGAALAIIHLARSGRASAPAPSGPQGA